MRIETRAAALHCGTVSRRVRAAAICPTAALCTGGLCVRAAALCMAAALAPHHGTVSRRVSPAAAARLDSHLAMHFVGLPGRNTS